MRISRHRTSRAIDAMKSLVERRETRWCTMRFAFEVHAPHDWSLGRPLPHESNGAGRPLRPAMTSAGILSIYASWRARKLHRDREFDCGGRSRVF